MNRLDIFIGVMIALIWGGNFIAAKYASGIIPPFSLSALRFIISAAFILPFCNKIQVSLWKVFGIAQIWGALYFVCFFMSMSVGLPASIGSIAIQSSIIFATLIGIAFFNERITIQKISGILIAITGIYVLKSSPQIKFDFGFMLMVFAAFLWAVASSLLKKLDEKNVLALTGYLSLFSLPVLILASLLTDFTANSELDILKKIEVNFELAFSILYMSIISTIIINPLWVYLLERNPVSQVMSFSLLVPVFSVIFAYFIFDEIINSYIIMAMALTLLGLALILIRDRKSNRAEIYPE